MSKAHTHLFPIQGVDFVEDGITEVEATDHLTEVRLANELRPDQASHLQRFSVFDGTRTQFIPNFEERLIST